MLLMTDKYKKRINDLKSIENDYKKLQNKKKI